MAKTKTSPLDRLMSEFRRVGYPVWTGQSLPKRNFLTTFSVKVDDVLGGGLLPGSVVEVSGPNGSGKSSLVASWLRGRDALWVALEYTDPTWIHRLGGDPLFVDPQTGADSERRFLGDDAWEAVREAVKANVPFIVLDSLGALLPSGEDEKEMTEEVRAGVARLITKGLRRTMPCLRESVLVLISQVMDVQGSRFPMLRSKGGHAKDHFAHVRLEVRRKDVIRKQMEGQKVALGQTIQVRTIKNKWAPPFRECLLYLSYDGKITDELPGKEKETLVEKMDRMAEDVD